MHIVGEIEKREEAINILHKQMAVEGELVRLRVDEYWKLTWAGEQVA